MRVIEYVEALGRETFIGVACDGGARFVIELPLADQVAALA